MIPDGEKQIRELEQDGEPTVRRKLAQGLYHRSKQPLAKEWLRQEEEQRSTAASARAGRRADIALLLTACSVLLPICLAIWKWDSIKSFLFPLWSKLVQLIH